MITMATPLRFLPVFLLCSLFVAPAATAQIVVSEYQNGGCEGGNSSSSNPRWANGFTPINGNTDAAYACFNAGSTCGGIGNDEGSNVFGDNLDGGTSDGIEQTVDLSSFPDENVVGNTFTYSVRAALCFSDPNDVGSITLAFLDGSGTQLGTTSSTAVNGLSTSSYQGFDVSAVAPAGTESVRVQLLCSDDQSSSGFCEIIYDNTSLTVTENLIPVELAAFTATVDARAVQLNWRTASETNNAGFEVQHAVEEAEWTTAGFVVGHGTTEEAQAYSHVVRDLPPGTYRFRLKQVDHDGTFAFSPEVEIVLGVSGAFGLQQEGPNPFASSTALALTVAQPQTVTAEVMDVLGRRVALLHQGVLSANEPLTLTVEGGELPSGTYLVRVTGERFQATRTVVLAR